MIRWLLPCLVLFSVGCATVSEEAAKEESADEPAVGSTTIDEDGTIRHSVSDRTVALLWARAERARAEERLEDAVASLERALQISPDDPVLWSRLAELQLLRDEYTIAENLALRSNALAGDQPPLRHRNWLLIAESRARRGDDNGAREARAEAERHGGS